MAVYAASGIEIHDVPDDASGVETHEMPVPWVSEMEDDLQMGLEAVVAHLQDKYGQYNVRFEIKEN
jgi:hypothetical protein